MKKFLVFLLMLTFITKVNAYENEIFKIEIPEGYTEEKQNESNNYRWTKNNEYISITVSDNTKLKYDISEYTEEDIKKQKEYLETGINKGLEKYNIKVTVSDIRRFNQDDIFYLEYDLFYPSEKVTGYNMYQKGRMYTTNNYITTIIYSSEKELKNNEEYKNVIESLKINDTKVSKPNTLLYIIITAVSGIVLIVVAIVFIKMKKKNKKETSKK